MSRTTIMLAVVVLAGGPAACSRTATAPASGPNPNPTMRLSPTALRSTAGADLGAVADRDTTTGVAMDGVTEAVLRFDHPVEVRRVKAYGTSLSVELPGGAELALSGAWSAVALADPVTVSELKVRLVAANGTARLDELEVWGAGRPRSPRDVQAMAEATRIDAAAFEDVRVLAGVPGAATLDPAGTRDAGRCLRAKLPGTIVRGARRAYLAYEADVPRAFALERSVDGDAMAGGFWVGNALAARTLVDELDPERLGTPGEIVLCVPPHATGKVQLSGVRVLVVGDDGQDPFDRDTHLRLATFVDGEARASAVAGAVELAFDRPTALAAAEVRLGVAPARLSSLEFLEAAGWSSQPDVELASTTSALPVAGRVARAVRLAFPAAARADLPSASVTEITAEGSGVGARVAAPRIVLTAPTLRYEGGRDVGERFGEHAYLAGWAESAAGAGRVEIGGAEVSVGGAFAVTLDRPENAGRWSVEIRARFPDGTEVVRTVDLDRDGAAELLQAAVAAAPALTDDARFGRENRTAWGLVDAEHGGKVTLGTDVTFEAPPGAVAKGTSVGITRKGPEELPPLDPGMVNVTAPPHGAYRFLPKGQKFLKPVRVGIPYDPSLLPDGVAPEEIQTWYYDDQAERWVALPRVELQLASSRVVSETTHFTFMINAVLVLPEHPGPTSFNPNSIKDLKAAEPSTGVDLMAPPGQNNAGTAQVGLPIRLPAARGAYQPELRIAYDSGATNGWLGVGWDLSVSSVQIDTRFGVPQYDTSEPRYLLDGEQLVPTDERPTCAGGGGGRRYRARVERNFRRVLRCGGDPTAYWFEVQDKQGNFFLYGKSPLARLAAYVLPAHVGQWFLERVVDTNGNLTEYAYDTDNKDVPSAPHQGEASVTHREDFRHLYLRSIQYSGRVPGKPRDALGVPTGGPYHVELVSEQDTRGRHLARPDTITTGRLGFKSVLRRRLKSILVQIDRNGGSDVIREYRLSYERGAFSFGKSRLSKVEVFGAGPAASRKLFHTHTFQYWDPNLIEPFGPPVAWTFTESPDDLSLTRSEESGFSTHGYGGIGPFPDKYLGSVGLRAGFNQHWTTTKSVLVDVNGDNLPDRVTEAGGGGYDVRFNAGTLFPAVARRLTQALPPGDPAAGERYPVPLPTLGKEEGKGWNTAVQASFAAFSANAGYSHFDAKTKEFLSDADGDGLVDVVQESGVLLNQLRSASQKGFAFAPQVTGTSLGSTPAETDPDQQRLDESIRSQLKPSDVVLEWIAPFLGRVDLSGSLSFVEHPRTSPIPPERDGVRVQVFLWNGDPAAHAVKLFEKVKTAAEVSVPTPVGVANLDVIPGWRVYVVLSTLADFPLDRVGPSPLEDVRFSPGISYTHLGSCPQNGCRALTDEEQDRIEPNGAATFHFEQALDFRIAGQPAPSVAIPANGTLRLDTSLVKRRSTDDIRVCVQRFGQKAEVKDLRCEAPGEFDNLFDETYPADDEGTYPLAASFPVIAGEKLVFRIQTDLPVDPSAADWAIAGRMETMCAADGTGCDAPPPEIADAVTFTGDAWFPVHNPVHQYNPPDSTLSVPDDRPLEPWVAPQAGTVQVLLNPPNGLILPFHQSSDVFVAVRTAKSLVVKKRLDELTTPVTAQVHLEQGERVYFEVFSDAYLLGAWTPYVTFTPDVFPVMNRVYPATNLRFTTIWSTDRSASATVRSRFGGGHHLWYFGAWHAPNDQGFDPARLFASASGSPEEQFDEMQGDSAMQDATKLASPLLPRRLGTYLSKAKPGLAARLPAFVSKDGATYVGAGVMHASREGQFVQTGAGAGQSTSLPAMFALGSALRQSSGESWSLSGGVSVGGVGASLSIATGATNQKSDVLDMNGDRVVDVVSGSSAGTSIRFTDIRDPGRAAGAAWAPDVGMRRSDDASASVGLGLSDPWRKLSDDGIVQALLSMFPAPGGGIGVNFSSTDRELVDVNGDGLPDEVIRDGGCFNVRLNLGTRFAAAADCVPVGNWSESRLDDLVGSLSDVLPHSVVTPERVRRTTSISLNANAGYTLNENWGATVNWDSSVSATAVVLVDVNGDGLPDYVRKSTKDGVFYVRMNRGYGFGEEQQLPVHEWPAGVTKPWLQDTGLAAAVNGVLRMVTGDTPSVDTVEASGTYNEVPTIGFVYSWFVGPLTPFFTPWLHFSVGGDATYRRVSGFALTLQDIDGDGFADHVLKAEKAPRSDNSAVWVRLNQMSKSNLLRRVERPLGGSIDLNYVRTGNTVDMPESRWVMSEVVVHDGRADGTPGHDIASSYTYAGGKYDRREREFLGFDRTTETQADGSVIARTFWNASSLVKGFLLTETLKDASGTQGRTYSSTINTYSNPLHELAVGAKLCNDATPFFLKPSVEDWCGSFFVSLDAVEHELRERSDAPADRILSRQEFGYDLKNGNVVSFRDLGDADASNTGDDVHATIAYADDAAAKDFYAIARPEELVVRNLPGDTSFLRKRTAHYDGAGNLDELRSFLDEVKYVKVNLVWNDDGRLSEIRQPEVNGRRHWIHYTYDGSGVTRSYPTRIEDAHGYVSTAEYDERFGEVVKTADVNGNVTSRVPDEFGRLERLYSPYDTTVASVRVEYAPEAAIPRARTRNLLPGGRTVDTIVFMDGMSRVTQTQKTAQVYRKEPGVSVTGRIQFDVMGRVSEQGISHFVANVDPGFVDPNPEYKTTFAYDVLGRKVRTVQPNGGIFETTYDLGRASGDPFLRRRATVVDPLQKTRVMYRRPDDRIAAVEERLGADIRTTRYAYDPLGKLRAITDAHGNETHAEYDRLGRRTQLRSLDAGTIDYAYDDMGNLVSRQDGNLRTDTKLPADRRLVTYEYDFDHLVAVHHPYGAPVKYEYGPPGAGESGADRIVRVFDDAGFETRGYGKLGEVVRSTRTVKPLKPNDSPQTFETRFAFDPFGRMLSVTYPDGERVDYGYDAAGLVNRAVGDRPATKHYEAATEVYLDTLAYDEFGQRRFARLGNGAETTWTYESDTRRLHGVHSVARGRVLQEITYVYDLVGNVKTMTNGLGEATGRRSGAVSYAFDYDDLYRLTAATGTAKARPGVVDSFKATYQFDEIHNLRRTDQEHWITSASDLGIETAYPPRTNHHFAYEFGRYGPHQAGKIGDEDVVWDANGNVLRECRDHGDTTCESNADHLRRYFWGEENELLAVIDGGGWNVARFIYDAQGQRVVKLGRGGESITIGQFFALKGRKAATKHVFVGETRIASKLLPAPGWEPDWSEGTSPSGPIVQNAALVGSATSENGCDPSSYSPQKCPLNPSPDPVIDRRLTDTKVRPETYYYHSDQLGSTSWVTDQNGRFHEHVEYFPYGEVWRDPQSDSDGAPVHRQQFLFTSKEFDEETGLYYFGARYFDPVHVLWTSVDAALGDMLSAQETGDSNRPYEPKRLAVYSYVLSNPLAYVDPDGNDEVFLRSGKYVTTIGDGTRVLVAEQTRTYGRKSVGYQLVDTGLTISHFHEVAATVYGESSPEAPGPELSGIAHTIKNKGAEKGLTMYQSARFPKWFFGRTNEAADFYRAKQTHSTKHAKSLAVRAAVIDTVLGGADPTHGGTYFEGTALIGGAGSTFKQKFIDTNKVELPGTVLGGTTFFREHKPEPKPPKVVKKGTK